LRGPNSLMRVWVYKERVGEGRDGKMEEELKVSKSVCVEGGKILIPRARVLAFVSACDSGRIFILRQERVRLNQIVSSLLGVADYPVS